MLGAWEFFLTRYDAVSVEFEAKFCREIEEGRHRVVGY